MESIPSNIALQQSMFRQDMGTRMLKNAANADKQFTNMIADAVASGVSGPRGQNLDITV